MNPASKDKAKEIFNEIKNNVRGLASEIVVCPPFIYLGFLISEKNGIALGAQDVFFEEKGSFTGEISPLEIKDLGVEYVILGHSERRKLFDETDEQINKKIKKSLEVGLKVILCVGETEEEKDQGKTNKTLENQIKQGLFEINNFENINIAYEPVWAIGTGNNCSVDETKNSIDFIRQFVKTETRILYGGSVKSDNSADYIKQAGVNGLLVGGSSLDAEEFVKIVKSIE